MRTVILVPRRDDNGWRDQLWAFCRAWWEEHHDPMPIYEGYHTADEGPFNRSRALNRASALADADGHWDLALVIDSDTISDPLAVRAALRHTEKTGAIGIAHDRRHMLNKVGTRKILDGFRGNWTNKHGVDVVYRDSVSCAVAVRRDAWDLVGGFDERFVGWGFEDTAFQCAVETMTGTKRKTERADCFHLWHPLQPEASKQSPTYAANHILKRRYEMAHMHSEQMLQVLDHDTEEVVTIPMIIHRTVPAQTSKEVERYWKKFGELHKAWDLQTYREPIDPTAWPLTGDLFDRCQNGAQKAGLIRLEALYTYGGVYVDSDVEPYRPFDPLINLRAFAAWEDERVVPDAVLGSIPKHPAFAEMLDRARKSIEAGEDAWKSGPGVTTAVLPGRDDVLVLPPGAFYPAHYHEKAKLGTNGDRPWVFAEHKWHHSWGTPEQRAVNARRQKVEEPAPAPMLTSLDVLGVKAAVCMPWRDNGDRYRRAAHDWCVSWWRRAGFEVVEANAVPGHPETRSAMCNNAVELAIGHLGADVIAIVDADTWTSPENMRAAMTAAVSTGQMTHAYTKYGLVGMSSSQRFQRHRGITIEQAARGTQLKLGHVSGAQAITAELWRSVGGYDERFVGWGFEDQAFELACATIGGGVQRIDGIALHWYHKPDPTRTNRVDSSDPRVRLMERYCEAAGRIPEKGRVARLAGEGLITVPHGSVADPKTMRALLSEPGGPLSRLSASVGAE